MNVVAAGPGDYAVGSGQATSGSTNAGLNLNCKPHPGPCPTRVAAATGGSGNVTVPRLNSAGGAGSFTLVLVANPITGAIETKTVTKGVFNVTF
jgi:hypothetical protein